MHFSLKITKTCFLKGTSENLYIFKIIIVLTIFFLSIIAACFYFDFQKDVLSAKAPIKNHHSIISESIVDHRFVKYYQNILGVALNNPISVGGKGSINDKFKVEEKWTETFGANPNNKKALAFAASLRNLPRKAYLSKFKITQDLEEVSVFLIGNRSDASQLELQIFLQSLETKVLADHNAEIERKLSNIAQGLQFYKYQLLEDENSIFSSEQKALEQRTLLEAYLVSKKKTKNYLWRINEKRKEIDDFCRENLLDRYSLKLTEILNTPYDKKILEFRLGALQSLDKSIWDRSIKSLQAENEKYKLELIKRERDNLNLSELSPAKQLLYKQEGVYRNLLYEWRVEDGYMLSLQEEIRKLKGIQVKEKEFLHHMGQYDALLEEKAILEQSKLKASSLFGEWKFETKKVDSMGSWLLAGFVFIFSFWALFLSCVGLRVYMSDVIKKDLLPYHFPEKDILHMAKENNNIVIERNNKKIELEAKKVLSPLKPYPFLMFCSLDQDLSNQGLIDRFLEMLKTKKVLQLSTDLLSNQLKLDRDQNFGLMDYFFDSAPLKDCVYATQYENLFHMPLGDSRIDFEKKEIARPAIQQLSNYFDVLLLSFDSLEKNEILEAFGPYVSNLYMLIKDEATLKSDCNALIALCDAHSIDLSLVVH